MYIQPIHIYKVANIYWMALNTHRGGENDDDEGQ